MSNSKYQMPRFGDSEYKPTFIGCLVDVSGSMEVNVGDGVDEEGGAWVRSLFQVIDDLVKYDVSEQNKIFTIAFGGRSENVFDMISAIESVQRCFETNSDHSPATAGTINRIFDVLKSNGARTIRRWAEVDTVSSALTETRAERILAELRSNNRFTRYFVSECLPECCRNWNGQNNPFLSIVVGFTQDVYAYGATRIKQASYDDIKQVEEKAMRVLLEKTVPNLNNSVKVFTVKKAGDILRGSVGEETLTTPRANELLHEFEPYIYGSTPMLEAMSSAMGLFSRNVNEGYHKLLLLISDGMPDSRHNLYEVVSEMKRLDVTIVSCYIARDSMVTPKKLHSQTEEFWEDGARLLFNMSSHVPTQYITRAILLKHGWDIDIVNNETRLFAHANHPDNLKDIIDLAKKSVCCQDALSEMIVTVSLDIYINQRNSAVRAHKQVGGTCYANAAAAVLHLTMHRILGRDGGYPDFQQVRDFLINQHGVDGADTFNVLREVCPVYRLRCQKVDIVGAMKAITAKRPVVAKYRLTEYEWDIFGTFYEHHRYGILRKTDLDISRRRSEEQLKGHAVVLTSFNSECLILMNSWGDKWGDNGFFRIENAAVLGLEFIDVYWTENDLSEREIEYYRKHGSEVANTLMRSLKGLQMATFTCPSCGQISKVTEYRGTITTAICPRCSHQFNSTVSEGNILALNMYLTSISR